MREALSPWLPRLGVDPRQYWLLMDLFGALAERRELFNQLGRDGVTLKVVTLIYAGIFGIFSLLMVAGQMPAATFLVAFLGITAFIMLSVLVSETSNSLVNPIEGLILAHQPINGATYTAAKLTHLLRIIWYIAPGLNAIPAFAGLFITGNPWLYPLWHLLATFGVGLLVGLACCGMFGWLIRFVPATRLRTAGQMAEMLPLLVFLTLRFIQPLAARIHAPAWLRFGWPVWIAASAVVVAILLLGLRSLSGDYLVRVAAIAQGRRTRARAPHRAPASRFPGGQICRAGFGYMLKMMRRDWQFRRQMIPVLTSLIPGIIFLVQRWRIPPFGERFSSLHILPHLLGFMGFYICSALPFGTDYKGVWVFLLTPGQAFAGFARGVHRALWLLLVAIPHALLIGPLMWVWGPRQALVFMAYSVAVASLYVSLEMRLIEGVPFGKQHQVSKGTLALPLMMLGMLVAAALVALQYFLVFHSELAVLGATAVFGGVAYLSTRSALDTFVVTMRYNLGIVSEEATLLYREVG